MSKPRLYVDMDNVLVDFASAIPRVDPRLVTAYAGHLDDVPGIFALMDPMPGAIQAFTDLAGLFEVFILSTPPWDNPSVWADKVQWVHRHLGQAEGSPACWRGGPTGVHRGVPASRDGEPVQP